jgi:phytoene synthase
MLEHHLRASDIEYLSALVRASDRPRYFAALFAPAGCRGEILALYGLAAEIARIPDQVSDATLGQMRLQFWRDGLKAGAAAGQGETPALRAVAAALRRHGSAPDALTPLIDARSADLYADAPPTLADLEELIAKMQAPLFRLAAEITGAAGPEIATAARHAGIAYGLARRLADFPIERARGRTILPLQLLELEGMSEAEVFAAERADGIYKVIASLGDLARHHLRAAREHLAGAQSGARTAFLPLAVVEPLLDRIDQLDADILARPVRLSDLEMLTRIGWARLSGRV